MNELILAHGHTVIIDDKDFDIVSRHNWYVNKTGYVISRRYGMLHRFIIAGCPKDKDIDHINGNRLDNRRSNLRICSRSQNMANSKKWNKNTSSQYKGVTWDKQMNKWRCKITCDYKQIFLGLFDDEHRAALAYDSKAKEIFGEFARLNVV